MRFATLLLAAGLAAAPAVAQDMPESYRRVQLSALDAQRRMLLTMADSMPERLYRDRATPEQRDFAQQIHHVAFTLPFALGRFMNAQAPTLPDTSIVLNTRDGLRSYINTVYDWAAGILRNQTSAERAEVVNMFGTRVPRWQVWDELHQHAWWTGGQIVANFRKHGMRPPGFGFF